MSRRETTYFSETSTVSPLLAGSCSVSSELVELPPTAGLCGMYLGGPANVNVVELIGKYSNTKIVRVNVTFSTRDRRRVRLTIRMWVYWRYTLQGGVGYLVRTVEENTSR